MIIDAARPGESELQHHLVVARVDGSELLLVGVRPLRMWRTGKPRLSGPEERGATAPVADA
jgi:hypothetical protein